MNSTKLITISSDSSNQENREHVARGLLTEVTKLKTSLMRRKLLNSNSHIATLEFTTNGVPHVHVVLDSSEPDETLLQAIRAWSADPRRTKQKLKIWHSGLDVRSCEPEWAASYLTKSIRDPLSFPVADGVSSSIRRFSTHQNRTRRTATKNERTKNAFIQDILKTHSLDRLKALIRVRCRISRKQAKSHSRQSAPANCDASTLPTLTVWDANSPRSTPTSPIPIDYLAAVYVLGFGPAFIRNPYLSRLELSGQSEAKLQALIDDANNRGIDRIRAEDVVPRVVMRGFQYVLKNRPASHSEIPTF